MIDEQIKVGWWCGRVEVELGFGLANEYPVVDIHQLIRWV